VYSLIFSSDSFAELKIIEDYSSLKELKNKCKKNKKFLYKFVSLDNESDITIMDGDYEEDAIRDMLSFHNKKDYIHFSLSEKIHSLLYCENKTSDKKCFDIYYSNKFKKNTCPRCYEKSLCFVCNKYISECELKHKDEEIKYEDIRKYLKSIYRIELLE